MDKHTIRTVSTKLNGEYGMNDVTLNVPIMIGAGGVEKIIEMELNEDEKTLLQASYNNIHDAILSVEGL